MKEKEKSSLVDLGKRLLEASRKGHADEVSMLMASGAPFTTDWLGTSPLHLAAQHGHTQTAEVLLRAGVSRDARTKVDRTPLHMAAQHGHTHVVELLISSGACANNADMLNMTPLHWACEHNHVDIVKILLRAGAKTDIKSKFGKTPVDIARAKDYIEVLAALSSDQDPDLTIPKTPKRPADRNNLSLNSMKKRQRTKKFPMTEGSWTGPEGPKENGNKPRRKATTPGASPKSAVGGGRRVSAPPQFPNAGSPSLRSPTENSIASLVSAAAIVKAKSESEREGQPTTVNSEGKSTTSATTKSQDSSVLDTLATLATATLSHTASSTSTTPQQVTAVPGRPIGIAPLTLPPTTPTLTTPLTPSSLFPMPSPLAALSALSSLSSPAQTSPLPLSFSMPVMTPQQVSTSGTQLLPLVQPGGTPFFSNAAGLSIQVPTPATTVGDIMSSSATSSGVAIAGTETGVKCVTLNTGTTPVPNTAAHTVIPQTVMSPFQLSNSSGQALIQTQLALTQMLAPTQGVQPSVVLEMNATTNKDGVVQVKVDQNQAAELLKAQAQSQEVANTQLQQDGSDTKQDDVNLSQNVQGTQEVLITLQVPAGLQHLQPQLVTDPTFGLQHVQLVQPVSGQEAQTQTVTASSQPNQVTIVQQPDSSAQATQEQTAGSAAQQAPVVQLQLPQDQLNLAHLMQNLGQGGLPLTPLTLTPQQMQLLANSQLQIGNQMPQLNQNSQQPRQQQVQQAAGTTQQQQQQPQQNVTQQLLAQSIPQRTLLPQNYVTQLGQTPVQTTADNQQQSQQQPQQQQPLIGPQVLLQVKEDLRKLLEQRQAEEEKARKDLEVKLQTLQRDSEKYRTELEHAQKEAQDYRGRLEEEQRENSRLHQLFEASKQSKNSSSDEQK
ncbi:unnamed protein product [Porites lobata]|uniref:GA-binding protein subunit beta-2 n=1 Tax=Porites lobata TaxID=104759 RepID=A0ABN8Q4S0_9CNID|nr:unnamed protein product [Porites lobata]